MNAILEIRRKKDTHPSEMNICLELLSLGTHCSITLHIYNSVIYQTLLLYMLKPHKGQSGVYMYVRRLGIGS